jgi:uncharacterized protein (DUF488 family)
MVNKMYYRRKIVLALLEAFPGKMERLKFQKLLFLLNTYLKSPVYHFLPYKYGCFSFQANAEFLTLEKKGFISTVGSCWTVNGNDSWLNTLTEDDRRQVQQLVHDFGTYTTDELIKYTYEQFPFYAIRSTVVNKYLDPEGMKKVQAATPKAVGPALFTLGYEGLSLEQYINLLLENGVKMLLDVRKNAMSMKYGFSKRTLQTACENVSIIYEHCPDVGIARVPWTCVTIRRYRRNQDRGRKDRFPDFLSLRTGHAVFPHPALRSMVLPLSGLTGLGSGIHQEEEPEIGKVGIRPPDMIFT